MPTGNELRKQVADAINGWIGAARGSAVHREILAIYNAYKPLARGYAVQVKDAWCATTVSAAWIKCGVAPYLFTECSCAEMIRLAKKAGIWVEDDAHVPRIGDAVLYDWDDDGKGDNAGAPEHIGVVTAVVDGCFTVTEGNMGSESRVGRRVMKINGRYIRGFICPDYDAIAKALTKENETEEETMDVSKLTNKECYEIVMKAQSYAATLPLPDKVRAEFAEAVDAVLTDGKRPMAFARRYETAIVAKRAVKKAVEEVLNSIKG